MADALRTLLLGALAGAGIVALSVMTTELARIAAALARLAAIETSREADRQAALQRAEMVKERDDALRRAGRLAAACDEYGCEADWHTAECPNNPANVE